ncbi:cobalt-factor II C(20)-methyltransferase [Peptostreptococcus sp. D1]|uniref:cobalt-factor II C(20)-methyltransferase n=1 Tax=Peptostreptococcus sp. D1 TaxID=72304 RepID=UPI0008E157C8|nr:cobalt-factor II C(20)-methyltransferase [Peptostreptococcus sp. D1]SFE32843.1 precorrin-2 C(20)-methyltransferase [Peptostreptococcus sp. D1]
MAVKKALLVVSFGTSYVETRRKTIEACENKLIERFPEMDFFRAWTSRMVIKKIKNRDDEHILFPDEALEKILEKGYREVYVQSLHLICGEEYHKLLYVIEKYRDKFDKLEIGRPLLTNLEDYNELAAFIERVSIDDCEKDIQNKIKTATVWMGHGTEHMSHSAYAALDYRLRLKEIPAYIGTVEGYPELEEVIVLLKKAKFEKVHLRPLLLVAGDHATNDMANSNEEDSWYSILKSNGFDVEVHLQGIGEFEFIQNKFVGNLCDEINEKSDLSQACKNNEMTASSPIGENNENNHGEVQFFGIGVGPGDSDLLTVKAINVLQSLDTLYVPQAKKGSESVAKLIVNKYLKADLEIKERYFPMNYNEDEKISSWNEISKEIIQDTNDGKKVGFVTLGDPMVYSTYVYLYNRVKDRVKVETIPGITSFINIASSNNFPLAMDKESLAIISCTDDYDRISDVLDRFESVVLMKVYKNFKEIIKIIEDKRLSDKSLIVSNSSMDNETVYGGLEEVKELDSVPYFTTILINKNM